MSLCTGQSRPWEATVHLSCVLCGGQSTPLFLFHAVVRAFQEVLLSPVPRSCSVPTPLESKRVEFRLVRALLPRRQAAPNPATTSGCVPTSPCILFLFSGPARNGDAVSLGLLRDLYVWAVDKHQGGEQHDVLRPGVRDAIRHACLSVEAGGSGVVRAAHLASPCRSFSPLRVDLPLRLVDDPMGDDAPLEFQAYIKRENLLISFCAEIFRAMVERSCPVTWENPPDLSVPDTPWFWPERAHLASLWHTPVVARIRAEAPTVTVTAAMCRFGSPYRKYFTLLAPAYMQRALIPFADMFCPANGAHRWHVPAKGTSEQGESHAENAGQYPPLLNAALLDALSWQPSQPGSGALPPGAVGHGAALSPDIVEAVRLASQQPSGFCSIRNLDHAADEQLWRTPLPDVRSMAAAMAPPPFKSCRVVWDGTGDWRALLPHAPRGPVSLSSLVGAVHLQRWEDYLSATQLAFDAIRAGQPFRSPGEFVLREEDLPEWARGVVWDCEDPANCRPVQASTAATPVAGARQVNRARVREVAAMLGWESVDPDIVQQLGHGGAELRSSAPLHTTAKWHHAGVASHFSVADEVVREERREQWTRVSQSSLPFVPAVFSPRDVVFQERGKIVDGELQLWMKPRVTHNMSAVPRELGGRADGVSVNSGVAKEEKTLVGLPSVQSYARAQAVCALAGGSDRAAANVYGIDETKAYCFLPAQRADHYACCYLWPDETGRVCAHVSERLVFGGSPWPNRYERFALLQCAWIQFKQRLFDASCPLPPLAQEWVRRRRELQEAGILPAGERQCWPAGIEPFIDDLSGRALADQVPVPDHLRDIPIGTQQTAAIGAIPAAEASRVAVHCRIAVAEAEFLGMESAADKTMCGTGMILLGAQLDAVERRVRCPALKRQWLRHAVGKMRDSLASSASVELRLLERFVGRLTHLSQFFPELRPPMAVGYALCSIRQRAAGDVRAGRRTWASVKSGGRREGELHTLLDVVLNMTEDDVGVSMAPAESFADRQSPHTLTVVTDASRADVDDGFGGFAFIPERPGTIFIMSEAWPPEVKAALEWAAASRSTRGGAGQPSQSLSMPAAETFAAFALASAVADLVRVDAVVSILDCAPAAHALSSLYSPAAQIRLFIGACRRVASRWLGVHVPREWNTDADRLSHPSLVSRVVADAEWAGLFVVRVSPREGVWEVAAAARALPLGRDVVEA